MPATLAYLCMAASARKADAERGCRNLKPIYRNSVLDPALAHSMMEWSIAQSSLCNDVQLVVEPKWARSQGSGQRWL